MARDTTKTAHKGAGEFEEAARLVTAEAHRLDDLAEDIRRRTKDMRWSGRSADHFRKHAAFQAVRAGQNREVLESLRVLLNRAAQVAAQSATTRPETLP
ncbi:hypothetical protein FKR81_20670 [Lentzea tibetensis]|uniref:WXG100 family type VII secretion target n=1 Tax=Lentzea tibetensis TaxID=2591470 RepID=A0A563ESK4_9PSEU|nr:hypothetical protein [Lentzea tibetensis]TWP50582.1 hypothetical protein FKR81_20670 [Lentzea tibetensis]